MSCVSYGNEQCPACNGYGIGCCRDEINRLKDLLRQIEAISGNGGVSAELFEIYTLTQDAIGGK
jgi:hypothetical protein